MPSAGIAAVVIGITIATVIYYFFASSDPSPPHYTSGRLNPSNRYENGQPSSNTDRTRSSYNSTVSGLCSICLETVSIGKRVKLRTCQHVFHEKCIEEWLTTAAEASCPNCRTRIP